jgi:hypothetical protein
VRSASVGIKGGKPLYSVEDEDGGHMITVMSDDGDDGDDGDDENGKDGEMTRTATEGNVGVGVGGWLGWGLGTLGLGPWAFGTFLK